MSDIQTIWMTPNYAKRIQQWTRAHQKDDTSLHEIFA